MRYLPELVETTPPGSLCHSGQPPAPGHAPAHVTSAQPLHQGGMRKEQSRLKYGPGVLIGTPAKLYRHRRHRRGGNCPEGSPIGVGLTSAPRQICWEPNFGAAGPSYVRAVYLGHCHSCLGASRYMTCRDDVVSIQGARSLGAQSSVLCFKHGAPHHRSTLSCSWMTT
jgi:hypothetical protein